jgi:type I restriction enzyme M protein
MTLHRFEAVIGQIHDHLYANANIRTPEELQDEVAKIVLAIVWGAREELLPQLAAPQLVKLQRGDQTEVCCVASDMHALFEKYKSTHRQYSPEVVLELDDGSIAFIRAHLQTFDFRGAERDWLGDALEVFRSTAAKRLGGQFFTDQRVTDLAISMLEYDPNTDDLVDICAGTGGFLIAAHKRLAAMGIADSTGIKGIEVDAKLAHLANSTLSHFGATSHTAVLQADSLNDRYWGSAVRAAIKPANHRCLASNPPFGIKITVKDPEVLSEFKLGHLWNKKDESWHQSKRLTPRSPDILFLERNLNLARPGIGRVAIVTPYQILSGPRLGFVREWLLRHARVIAVIDLPGDTFQPWTGTKTSLLVYERREKPMEKWIPESYPIFMAVAKDIGHDRRGKPVIDEQGNIKTDLPEIGGAFERWKSTGELPRGLNVDAFIISASEVTSSVDLRLNASFHAPRVSRARSRLLADVDSAAFTVVRLGDVVERIFCPGRFKRNYVAAGEGGVLFLGGTQITQLSPTNRKYLSQSDPHIDELRVIPGWVLVTRSGSTGIVSSVPPGWSDVAISDHVIRIVPRKDSEIPPEYIEAFLRSRLGQDLIAAGIFGSVIDEITTDHLANLPIPVPKDRSTFKLIAEKQREANKARAEAIDLSTEVLNILDQFHLSDIDVVGETAV